MSAKKDRSYVAKDKSVEITKKGTKAVRIIFVLFGIGYVLYSFTRTLQKYKEGNVLAKQETKYFDKYRYPSVTFCYKFKHGSKDVMNNYYPSLYKKWQATGMHISPDISLIGKNNSYDFIKTILYKKNCCCRMHNE